MQEWKSEKPQDSWKQIQQFWLELWKTREEFELELVQEMKGYQLDMILMERTHEQKIQHIKQKTQFLIQSLESTLIEIKVQYERKINILEMQIADEESKGINNTLSFNEIDDILNNPPKIITMVEANRRISRLEKAMRSQQNILGDLKTSLDVKKVQLTYEEKKNELLVQKLDLYRVYRQTLLGLVSKISTG